MYTRTHLRSPLTWLVRVKLFSTTGICDDRCKKMIFHANLHTIKSHN